MQSAINSQIFPFHPLQYNLPPTPWTLSPPLSEDYCPALFLYLFPPHDLGSSLSHPIIPPPYPTPPPQPPSFTSFLYTTPHSYSLLLYFPLQLIQSHFPSIPFTFIPFPFESFSRFRFCFILLTTFLPYTKVIMQGKFNYSCEYSAYILKPVLSGRNL